MASASRLQGTFYGYSAWSSCSKSAIQDKLQQLWGFSSNCLDDPPEPLMDVCGDGVVSGSEECDQGKRNGVAPACCTAGCRLAPSAQCANGECCDQQTCTFKQSSTRCREHADECDLETFCTGANATCPPSPVRPDGTPCTAQGGPGARCFGGACKSADLQCAEAFAGYTGSWVYGARNGVAADCSSGCGELMCTNSEWRDHCVNAECPANYTCIVEVRVCLVARLLRL